MQNLRHLALPSYIKVAKILDACLPDALCQQSGSGLDLIFEFLIESNSVIHIDSLGWSYGFEAKADKWRSFGEGSLENVAEHLLKPMVVHGIRALKPPRDFDYENPQTLTEELR